MITKNQRPEISKLYIDPEETLTDVRERLTHISTPEVTLIIPRSSRLCHALDWKLLARRAQELAKDIVVASADPRICALARSVHFKIEETSQESTPKRSRPFQSQKKEASRKTNRKAS